MRGYFESLLFRGLQSEDVDLQLLPVQAALSALLRRKHIRDRIATGEDVLYN